MTKIWKVYFKNWIFRDITKKFGNFCIKSCKKSQFSYLTWASGYPIKYLTTLSPNILSGHYPSKVVAFFIETLIEISYIPCHIDKFSKHSNRHSKFKYSTNLIFSRISKPPQPPNHTLFTNTLYVEKEIATNLRDNIKNIISKLFGFYYFK